MRGADFTEFLARSLTALARDVPMLHRRLAAQMTGRPVRLAVDGPEIEVVSDGEALQLLPAEGPPPAVRLCTDAAAILRMVDGERSLEDAVLGDEVELFGAAADLAAFHADLTLYLHAAVRCPALGGLLREFRAGTIAGSDAHGQG